MPAARAGVPLLSTIAGLLGIAAANATVPELSGKVIVRSAVGSVNAIVVSYASSVPS